MINVITFRWNNGEREIWSKWSSDKMRIMNSIIKDDMVKDDVCHRWSDSLLQEAFESVKSILNNEWDRVRMAKEDRKKMICDDNDDESIRTKS